jgi:hypothetical protein
MAMPISAKIPPAMPPTTGPHFVTASEEEDEEEVLEGSEDVTEEAREEVDVAAKNRERVVVATVGATVTVAEAEAFAVCRQLAS